MPELAERFTIVEAIYDPWRAQQMAQEWEQRRIRTVKFPQHDARMIPASSALYDAIIEKRLTTRTTRALNAHVAAAVAKSSRRGWRLDQAPGGGNIDGVIALAMAVERAAEPAPEVKARRVALRPCIGCGRLIARGSRCARCERARLPHSPGRLRGRRGQELRGPCCRRSRTGVRTVAPPRCLCRFTTATTTRPTTP